MEIASLDKNEQKRKSVPLVATLLVAIIALVLGGVANNAFARSTVSVSGEVDKYGTNQDYSTTRYHDSNGYIGMNVTSYSPGSCGGTLSMFLRSGSTRATSSQSFVGTGAGWKYFVSSVTGTGNVPMGWYAITAAGSGGFCDYVWYWWYGSLDL